MANNLGYTPGSGALASTVQFGDSSHGQVVVLSIGTDRTPIPADAVNGLLVNVKQVQGSVAVTGSVSISGTPTVNVGTVSGTVTVAGTVAVSSLPAISGTVTATQGNAGTAAQGWFSKITDGTNTAAVTGTSLNVNVTGQVGGGYSQQDRTAFTSGTTPVVPVGGVYNDSLGASPSSGQVGLVRITAKNGLHINLRDVSGAEITTGNGLAVKPDTSAIFGTNLAQVNGNTVATAGTGTQKVGIVGATGTVFSDAAPLSVQEAPRTGKWRAHVTLASSQTNVAVYTPAGGKTAVIEGWILTTGTGDVFVLSDGNQSDSTELYKGSPAAGTVVQNYPRPEPLSAINNVLRYSSGASYAGDLTVWGYEV